MRTKLLRKIRKYYVLKYYYVEVLDFGWLALDKKTGKFYKFDTLRSAIEGCLYEILSIFKTDRIMRKNSDKNHQNSLRKRWNETTY